MTAGSIKPLPGTKNPPFTVRVLRQLWRLTVDQPYRGMLRLHWRRPRGTLQPFNDTTADRYPRIFSFVQKRLGANSDVKILSYGCSTGEEVFSLRRYFPRAFIKGIDINPGNIAACLGCLDRAPDTGIAFEIASATTAESAGWYDAIFCMAVHRHGELAQAGVTRCDHLIRFEDFAQAVEDFKRCLKPGGLLVIRHSNFRLCDTRSAADFTTIMRVGFLPAAPKTPIFGPDNRLMPGVEYVDAVFRKRT
jgi:SAM-dependent methyltransferase